MKKIIVFIISIVIIILSVFTAKYLGYKSKQSEIKEQNREFESSLNKEIFGTQLTTFINRAVDNNEKNHVQKDEQGFYIENDTNSIKIEVKITDNETTYQMETIYNGGMTHFIEYYNTIRFECTQIKYNKVGRVSYMLFEQKTN